MLQSLLPEKDHYRNIKLLIYLYGVLLIFEGALRKWIVPSLSNPLLLVREPFLVLIYAIAIKEKCFPANGYIANTFLLAALSFLFGLFSDSTNILITIYGLKINYLHIPLIFVMGSVLTREDVYKIGKFFLLMAVPMTCILVLQFYRPRNHFINLEPGGAVTMGITGAMGRFRPSGTFSFITGLAAYYPLVTAFLLGWIIQKRPMNMLLKIAIGTSIIIAMPFSISRLLALSCAVVLVGALIGVYYSKSASKTLTRILFLVGIFSSAATFLPIFEEGSKVFERRWELSTGEGVEGFKENIVSRSMQDYLGVFEIMEYSSLTGEGVGTGSNVAAKMLTGKTGFSLAESEWQKIILELGPFLGLAFIGLRIALALYTGNVAFRAAKGGNALPITLFFANFLLLINGQWAPPTTLGLSIFGAGLTLASANSLNENLAQKRKRRGLSSQFLKSSEHRIISGRPQPPPFRRRHTH